MQPFPFSDDEWELVKQAATLVTNATLMDDDILREHYYGELVDLLDTFRVTHGDHPILLETHADFEQSPSLRIELYRKALAGALLHQLSTFSIRIPLAQALSEDFQDHDAALAELLACEQECQQDGDDYEREQWLTLYKEIQRKLG